MGTGHSQSSIAISDAPVVDAEVVEPDPERVEYIKGLRALADALEQHPELLLPYDGSGSALAVIPFGEDESRTQLAAWAKVLPGRKDKKVRDTYLDLAGSFAGLHVKVIAQRNAVCERVVVGTREVEEEVPDPEALAAVPKVKVTKTVEDVEWQCHPLLASTEPAEQPEAVSA